MFKKSYLIIFLTIVCLLFVFIFYISDNKDVYTDSQDIIASSPLEKDVKSYSQISDNNKPRQDFSSRINRKYSSKNEEASIKGGGGQEKNTNIDQEASISSDIESQNPMDQIMGGYVDEMYKEYFLQANLTPQKKKVLSKILVESHQLQQTFFYMLFDPKMDEESILKKQEDLYFQQKNKIDGILTKNEIDMLDSYNLELPKKIAQKTIDTSLQHLELPADIKKDLSRVILEEKQASSSAVLGFGENYGIPLKMIDHEFIRYTRNIDKPEEIEKIILKTEAENEKILNRFRDEKNPSLEQIKIVKSFLDNTTTMLKSITQKAQ